MGRVIRGGFARVRSALANHLIRRNLIRDFLSSDAEFEAYRCDFEASKLVGHIDAQKRWFEQTVVGETVRGDPFAFGALDLDTSLNLYAVLRHLRPRVLVETGVCNGLSTAFILLALHDNDLGHLYSIDFPEVVGEEYDARTFWEGKRGAVIPPGRKPGWLIPDELRTAWTLLEGRSQDRLPALLSEVGDIDFFCHDSEHSYDCMSFEFAQAYPALRHGGLLVSDDYRWNDALAELAGETGSAIIPLGPGTAFIVK